MRALTYIEIDVPDFVNPAQTRTFRFTYPCDYLPANIEAIPSLVGVRPSPATISLGSNLGTRANIDLQFSDHKHIFASESYNAGSFWGKWRARYGTRLQGRPLRWIQGLLGQTLAQMETRHFIVDATDGPTPNNVYTITAKDILKFADSDRAQAPRPSSGFMIGAIDADDTAFTLSPAGIGNAEYPASGFLALGGEEIVAFTRSGDVVTITARGQLGTERAGHDAGSRVQRVLRYVGQDPAVIIRDLLVTYAGVPASFIPLSTWQNETSTHLQQLYSANIAEPTAVQKLVSELIEQAALAIWWEPLTQRIRLQVLRAIPTTAAVFDEGNTLEGSLSIKEQPGSRLSQVFTYFGQRNPLAPIDQENNYRSAALTIDGDAELAYGLPAIKKIYSRWIPFGARTVALRLNALQLGRFRDPPRRFGFHLFRHGRENPQLGGGYRVKAWPIQTTAGAPAEAPIQITRLNPLSDRYEIEAEEMLFTFLDPIDLTDRLIVIDSNINDVNLRALHDAIYPAPTGTENPPITVTCVIENGVIVGSTETSAPAFDVGSWPAGIAASRLKIHVQGRIQGRGGDGGRLGALAGLPGGVAFFTRKTVTVDFSAGQKQVWGGGGGGGAGRFFVQGNLVATAGGGGGAGQEPGDGGSGSNDESGTAGFPGTTEAGGPSGFGELGGDGGAPGQPGAAGIDGGPGGAAGRGIDGVSFITFIGSGDIRGGTVN